MGVAGVIAGCLFLAQLAGPAELFPAADPPASTDAEQPLRLDPVPDARPADAASLPSLDTAREPAVPSGAPSIDAPASQEATPPSPPAERGSLPPAASDRQAPNPPELAAEMLTLSSDSPLIGRPLTLVDALSPTQGQPDRIEVVHAYWRLAQAVGQYRAMLDESRMLESFDAAARDELALRAARAAARAAVDRAQLAAVNAQYELAAAALLPTDGPLPLPADLPHVGPYRTRFDELSSQRAVPPRTRLINRALPIGREVIYLRAEAVNAVNVALKEAVAAYQSGQVGIASVLNLAADWGRQRRALLASVCQYNHDIAEYATSVATPQITTGDLVAMLITTGSGRSGSVTEQKSAAADQISPMQPRAREPSAVQPATANEPAADRMPASSVPSAGRVPTLAPPKKLSPAVGEEEAAPIQPGHEEQVEGTAEGDVAQRSLVPITRDESEPSARIARRPALPPSEALPNAVGLYPALVDKEPAVQARELAAALSAAGALPEPKGEPVTLRECLRGVPAADRQQVIDWYWTAVERGAEYRALAIRRDEIEELALLAGADGTSSTAPPPERLKAARTAAEADLLEARRQLLESQFELGRAMGRPADSPWPVPTTEPHCGPYLLKLDAQPRVVVESWRIRRLAQAIPDLAQGLARQATAAVEADSARAAATAAYPSGERSLDEVLAAIDEQGRQTLTFLKMLGTYNREIAQYVLAVLPPTISEDQLIGTLVRQ